MLCRSRNSHKTKLSQKKLQKELNFVINYYKIGRIKTRNWIRYSGIIVFHLCAKREKNAMIKNFREDLWKKKKKRENHFGRTWCCQSLNSLFSFNSSSETITDPIMKIILKYRNHPRILTTGEVMQRKICQSFFVFSSLQRRNSKIYFEFRHI